MNESKNNFDHFGRPYARNQNQEPDVKYEMLLFE